MLLVVTNIGVALAGCSAAGRGIEPTGTPIVHPALKIIVTQTAGDVVFEFHVEEEPLTKRFTPSDAIYLVVSKQYGPVLWSVISPVPVGAHRIRYGVVPKGFYQNVPREGAAPSLVDGETYIANAQAGGQGAIGFTYRGR